MVVVTKEKRSGLELKRWLDVPTTFYTGYRWVFDFPYETNCHHSHLLYVVLHCWRSDMITTTSTIFNIVERIRESLIQ
jgi:hypothetical protein